MSQKGAHTWDLTWHYHKCPECGFIIESRDEYKYSLGKYQKELTCDRCGDHFMVEKKVRSSPGPIFGDAQPIEVDW